MFFNEKTGQYQDTPISDVAQPGAEQPHIADPVLAQAFVVGDETFATKNEALKYEMYQQLQSLGLIDSGYGDDDKEYRDWTISGGTFFDNIDSILSLMHDYATKKTA